MKPASLKIPCIEDDVETGELITEELAEHGYTVITVHDGESRLAVVLREAPDLMLYDVGMPGMIEFESLGRLRTLAPRCAEVPFTFLAAMAQRKSKLRGHRLGVDDCVTKPTDPETLVSTVQARLARRPRTHAAHPPV